MGSSNHIAVVQDLLAHGTTSDADTIKALVEAVESGCPTLDTFRRPVPVTGEVFLNGTPVTSV